VHTVELWKSLLLTHFADFLRHAAPELAGRLDAGRASFPDPAPLLAGFPQHPRIPFLLAEIPVADTTGETLLLHVLPYEAAGGADPSDIGGLLVELQHHLCARHHGPVLQLVFYPSALGLRGRWTLLPQGVS
jgi:hypothetical protein